MRRLLLLVCMLLAACGGQATDNAPRNPPTLIAPTAFVEAAQPITLNNVTNLKYLARLDAPGTPSTLFSYAISPDSTRLVGVNNDEMLGWNLVDGKLIFETARNDVTRVFYSPDKTEIYGVDRSGLTTSFDANSGARKASFQGNPNYNATVAYSPDNGWLALGGADGSVKVWDTFERQALATIDAHSEGISGLAFSPDGDQLATAGVDGVVRVWNWRDRSKVAETKLDPALAIRALAFSPDASRLAIGSDKDAHLSSLSDPSRIDALDTGRGGTNQLLAFAPDGRFLLGGNSTAGLSLWALDDLTAARLPDTQGDTLAASFSPDGSLLVTAVLNGKVALWNLVQVNENRVNKADLQVGTQQILTAEWTPDSRLLLLFDASGPIYLWGIGA